MKKGIIVSAIILVCTFYLNAQTDNPTFNSTIKLLPNSELYCSPNPVKDQLVLHFDNNTDQNLKWGISDLSGRMIASGTHPAREESLKIETGNFQKGVFLLTVAVPFGNDRKTVQFVKD